MAPTCSESPKRVPSDPCPSSTHRKVSLNWSPPHMTQVLLELLPWSEFVHESFKSCVSVFHCPSLEYNLHYFTKLDIMGTPLLCTGSLGFVSPEWDSDSLFFTAGPLISLLCVNHHAVSMKPNQMCLCPSYPSWCGCFIISLVTRILFGFSFDVDGSQQWLLCI